MIVAVPSTDKLSILSDPYARVGTDNASWEGVFGTNGIGSCNSNGIMLLETCVAHGLLIINSIFHLPHYKKTPWMLPQSKH